MLKHTNTIAPDLVSIRDITTEDIASIADYWFNSPPGFLEQMGVDPEKLPSREDFEMNLIEKCSTNSGLPKSKLNAVAIMFDGGPIGFHTLNPVVEGDYGIFHAHIWNPEFRGRGICVLSYPKACRLFFARFDLKRILFKTPVQNRGAIRVKEKLGIPCVGEEVVGFGIIRDGTSAKVFELKREDLD
jgi:RimJ/RimL family protein N-acetyltransferase